MAYNLLEALDWVIILEVIGVGDLSWGPLSLIVRIVDHRSVPFAPVNRVGFHWPLPLATPGSIGTLRVGNGWRNPVTILLVIPFFGFLRVRVRDSLRFVIKPTLRFDSILVNNLVRSVVIPIVRLGGNLDRNEGRGCYSYLPWWHRGRKSVWRQPSPQAYYLEDRRSPWVG